MHDAVSVKSEVFVEVQKRWRFEVKKGQNITMALLLRKSKA